MKRPIPLLLVVLAACHASPSAKIPEAPTAESDPSGASVPLASREAPEPPIALTASDGTGLQLAAIEARAVVDGPLAFTELHLAFDNPNDRVLEGTFRIALPQGASLGRFAMKINEAWQEGEVVELKAAREAYEDFLHRKQDPALMEKAAGNEFSARVFPIPARGRKELIVAWASEVKDGRFVLPLKGLPELASLDVDVNVIGGKPMRLNENGKAPRDLVVDVPSDATGVRNGELAIVRVRPQAASAPDPLRSAVVLVDTSASRALGFDAEVDLVGKIVEQIGKNGGDVTVACFDQTTSVVFEGRASAFGSRELGKIRARTALGASDVERALAFARDAAKRGKAHRVVLVSDGVATSGATDTGKLAAKVASLKDAGVERLDAVAIGGIRDEAGLSQLVRGHLAHDGVVADGFGADVVRRLGEATTSNIAVSIEGAQWSWPKRLDGVQAGDTYSVYAEVPKNKEVRVSVGGAPSVPIALRPTERPLVDRIVAQAKVASLIERERTAPSAGELRKSIVEIATQHRIMTPYTAMLVLETEWDYQRFGIARTSLTDVLAVQDGRVKPVHRRETAIAKGGEDRDERWRERGEEKPSKLPQWKDGVAGNRPKQPAPRAIMKSEVAKEAPRPMLRPAPETLASGPAPRPMGSAAPARIASKPMPVATATAAPAPAEPPPPPVAEIRPPRRQEAEDDFAKRSKAPYDGTFATVMAQISEGRTDGALAAARTWRREAPGDVLALVALGEAAEAAKDRELAARAYGSIIDLFSNRADLRRLAGERLERLADPAALDLAIDTFQKAAVDRPDHPASHRLLAFALARKKLYARAFEAIALGRRQSYPDGRFAGVDRILTEDLGLIAAAWAAAEPQRKEEILRKAREAGGRVDDEPSLRFVLNWETDANDVDFHIHDARGGHAYYGDRMLGSGGELYADVTTGYGPECFTIRGKRQKDAAPYRLEAHYYSRGPMGYGMGKLEVIEHDGKGGLTFEERPFIVMVDQAYVDLGTVR
jgi:hypothetical protein